MILWTPIFTVSSVVDTNRPWKSACLTYEGGCSGGIVISFASSLYPFSGSVSLTDPQGTLNSSSVSTQDKPYIHIGLWLVRSFDSLTSRESWPAQRVHRRTSTTYTHLSLGWSSWNWLEQQFFRPKTEKISNAILWTPIFTVRPDLYRVRSWSSGFLLYEGKAELAVDNKISVLYASLVDDACY